MRFSKTIEARFKEIEDVSIDAKKPAVSATLRSYLQNQSQRIDNLLMKKSLHNEKLKKIETQNLTYRQNLRSRLQEQQHKHQKKRKQFLDKRVKQQKFKVDEVQRKRNELFEKLRTAKKRNEQTFRKNKSETVDFWKTKQAQTLKYYKRQSSAFPLHEDAVSRKKSIEKRNQAYAEEEKDKLLAKHSHFQQHINQILAKKQKYLDNYNEKLQEGYRKNQQILEMKNSKFVNEVCFHQDRSVSLLKAARKAYDKQMETKALIEQDNLDRKKQNLMEKNTKRAQSMKQCRCHKRGGSDQAGMSHSILMNQQQGGFNQTKRTNWSVQQTRNNFMARSQINLSKVQQKKKALRQYQDIQDEKRLMIEKEISSAVKTRQLIRNHSNNQIRQARVLG